MSLTDEEIDAATTKWATKEVPQAQLILCRDYARAIESAATAPLLERIAELEEMNAQLREQNTAVDKACAELEANEKVLLAQVQGHTEWRERIIKASERAYGESAIRYKFSLTKSGKCMNTFPREIDGRWFALVPAENDGHIGHIARIAELERELEALRKDAGWRAIETAPKDGTAVLVSEGRFCYSVEWNEEFDWWAVDDNKLGPFRLRGQAPTHWMPLPPPPDAEKEHP
jgi:hypothetical protein